MTSPVLSNAEIADRLAALAQLMSAGKENPYKIRAYRKAAAFIRTLPESIDDLVRTGADLTRYEGIGAGISGAVREIVLSGRLEKLETLRSQASPELAGLGDFPRLDPARVLRIYKRLKIGSVEALREHLESGAIDAAFGSRMAAHIREGLSETHAMLLYKADQLAPSLETFLVERGARRAQAVGDYRRRVEVIDELAFIVDAPDFPALCSHVERYGGRTPVIRSDATTAVFALSIGIHLRIERAREKNWGLAAVRCTGSPRHLEKLSAVTGELKAAASRSFPAEAAFYEKFNLQFIEPELREGHDEVERAAAHTLPTLVSLADIRGDLHAHSTSSDGSHSIEQMAIAARERGYEYIGITDHSQSLKIARGVSVDDLRNQIRVIDRLNETIQGIRILKSAEVDILEDGALDYPDDLLEQLDYTVCSIHSRFSLGKAQQTERILRAMDNRNFTILGHATGRLLLMRPGYELDIDRIIRHARQRGCYFEINSSPHRLDVPSSVARLAVDAGIKIAINTDAHSTRELDYVRCGIDQARRAGLTPTDILNTQRWESLRPQFRP